MPNMFNHLPLDVIDYVIRPFIVNDYFARIALNSVLPPVDRKGTPLKDSAVAQLNMTLNVPKLDRSVRQVTNAVGTRARAEALSGFFDLLIKQPFILQHSYNFRQAAIAKAATFADPVCSQYSSETGDAKDALVERSKRLLELIDNIPYVGQVTSSSADPKWSAVDGAGTCLLVDNSRAVLLATAAAEKLRRSTPHWRMVFKANSVRYDYYQDEYYEDGDDIEEFGYFDECYVWVCLRSEDDLYDDDTPVHNSRRGTVMGTDGWETVVSKKRR